MGNYRIFETNELIKNIEKISGHQKIFIVSKLLNSIYPQLREEPHYGRNIKKLTDYKPEIWRYRIGRFRLFYSIDENGKIIYLLSLNARKDSY